MHPNLERAFEILEPAFIDDIITKEGMGLLANPKQWVALLNTLPTYAKDRNVGYKLNNEWSKGDCHLSPKEKWAQLKVTLKELTAKNGAKKAPANMDKFERQRIEMWPVETVFKHTYPRLDINVSKMQNHLLKSPFCVHPKTGRVCIPMDATKVDSFDPFAVPTLPQIVGELEEAAKKGEVNGESKGSVWDKTSLKESFGIFQQKFLNPMMSAREKILREKKEEEEAKMGDF